MTIIILIEYFFLALLTSIQESKGLDTDHAGGYFATHDYQLSIKTPEWKTDLSEVYCTKWSLPSVISIPAGSEGLGIVLKLRDIGELYRPLNSELQILIFISLTLHFTFTFE